MAEDSSSATNIARAEVDNKIVSGVVLFCSQPYRFHNAYKGHISCGSLSCVHVRKGSVAFVMKL